MSSFSKLDYVEEPLLKYLKRLGWAIRRAGDTGKFAPFVTYRGTYKKSKAWNFAHEDLNVGITKKYKYKIEFIVSRYIQIGEGPRYSF